MIGLDTNVVVRYLVKDDPAQAAAAATLINGLSATEPGFLSLVTTVELYWVLHRAYQVGADRCGELIDHLLESQELRVERSDIVREAVTASRTGVDFADAVIAGLGRAAGCDRTVTFDRRAARGGVMELVKVRRQSP